MIILGGTILKLFVWWRAAGWEWEVKSMVPVQSSRQLGLVVVLGGVLILKFSGYVNNDIHCQYNYIHEHTFIFK